VLYLVLVPCCTCVVVLAFYFLCFTTCVTLLLYYFYCILAGQFSFMQYTPYQFPRLPTRYDKIYNQNPYQFLSLHYLMCIQFNSIFTLTFTFLQNRWMNIYVTLWINISKQVRKFTPHNITFANKFTFLEINLKLLKIHYCGNNNCGFVFYFQILFEAFP
jgi:hypothetical protein